MQFDQCLVQLTPEMWITQSRWLHYNSGILISQGQACLIDPGMDQHELAGLARFVASQGAVPAVIVVTHWHWDHLLGPEYFPGVPVIAHSKYPGEIACNQAGILAEIGRWEAQVGATRQMPFVIPPAHRTVEDGESLTVGGLELTLLHVPGHSADQLAVYHPGRGALWASDLLSDQEIPFVSDRLAAYEHTLSRLAALDVRVLAPGHGGPTIDADEARRRLEHDRAYLAALRANVSRALAEGLTLEETVDACAAIDYRRRSENKPYHRLNVEGAYFELGGRADPTRTGWTQG